MEFRSCVVLLLVVGLVNCFQENSFVVDSHSDYPFYPDTLFETITHRVIHPMEQNNSPSNYRTATSFTRPFANKFMKAGETILTLKPENAITPDVLLRELPFFSDIEFTYSEEPFVMWLLWNIRLGDESNHKKFIDSLPEKIINPMLFSSDDWKSMAVNYHSKYLNDIVNADRETLLNACKRLLEQIQAKHPDIFEKFNGLSFDEYLYSYVIVKDNIRFTPIGLVMYPALNFAHSLDAAPATFDGDNLVIFAGKDYEIGDQIFVNYGNISNHDLLLYHSGYLEDNIQDCLHFSINTRNPYWLMIAEPLFGITSSIYTGCIPVHFQPESDALVRMRIVTSNDEDLDSLDSALKGEMVSLPNELRTLRAILITLKSQGAATTNDANGKDALLLWNGYSNSLTSNLEKTLQRIVDLWGLYLQL